MRTISGGLGGGAEALFTGMFIFTACVCTGIVMMNMISNTNITSINGVVFISTIMSSSAPPTCIAISGSSVHCLGGGSVMKPTLAMPARWQATTRRPTLS